MEQFIESVTSSWWPIIVSLIFCIIKIIRQYAAGGKCSNRNLLVGKTVLITGGATGIGFSIAKELARRKAKVIIACRQLNDGYAAKVKIKRITPDADVDVKYLDVSNMATVRRFAEIISHEYDQIDILINNAAVIFHEHYVTKQNLELTFATNYLGPFLLSHLLLPLLAKSCNGRIINMAAAAHRHATFTLDNFNFEKKFVRRTAFGQTKLLLVLLTKHMARLLRAAEINVTVNAVNPGIVRGTNHLRQSPLGNSLFTRISVWPWTMLFLKSAEEGAQSAIYVATDNAFQTESGQYISDCQINEFTPLGDDVELLEGLYAKSCEKCSVDGISVKC